MFCTNCGSEISDNSVFCTNCGAQVRQQVPNPPPEEPITEEIAATIAGSSSGSSSEPAVPSEAVPEPSSVAMPAQAPQQVAPVQPVQQEPVNSVPVQSPVYHPEPPVQPIEPAYAPIPAPVAPQPAAAAPSIQAVQPAGETKPVSTGLYVLMMLLMCLPIVGLIVHIIGLATARQKSFKNYCRAVVILGIIGLLLVIAGLIVGYVMLDSINEFLADFNIRIDPMF